MKNNEQELSRQQKLDKLQVKDYSNSQSLIEWLELAEEIIRENVQSISDLSEEKENCQKQMPQLQEGLINETDEEEKKRLEQQIRELTQKVDGEAIVIEKHLTENDFIAKELEKFQDSELFLDERREQAQLSDSDDDKEILDELESTLREKATVITELKKLLAGKSGKKKVRHQSLLVQIQDIPKFEDQPTPFIDDTQFEEDISDDEEDDASNIKDFLTKLKNKLENSEEEKEQGFLLSVEQALENSDIKEGCTDLLNELNASCDSLTDYLESRRFLLEFSLENWEEIDGIESDTEYKSTSKTSPPETPRTPREEKIDKPAKDWLEDKYKDDKDNETEITSRGDNINLTEGLLISDYPELESISLTNMEITELIIKNCPKVEEIEVYSNKITKIIGLENLPELKTLSAGSNEITELDVSKNTQLETFLVFDNENIKITGLQYLSNLVEFNGGYIPLNLAQINKEELGGAAKGLGIDEEKIENISPEEIKKLIKEEGDKSRENKDKLNNNLLMGLIGSDGRVSDDKLKKVVDISAKNKIKIKKLEAAVRESELEKKQAQQEASEAWQKVKEYEKQKRREEERRKEEEIFLEGKIGKSGIDKIKKNVEKILERREKRKERKKEEVELETKIEVDVNNK